MKIKPEHIEIIHNAMKETLLNNGFKSVEDMVNHYRENKILANDIYKRVRWDIVHNSNVGGVNLIQWICTNIYPYANDDHINTVLKMVK